MSSSLRKCHVCNGKAAVFVTFVTNAAVRKVSYCLQHAEDRGVLSGHAFFLLDNEVNVATEEIGDPGMCPDCRATQDLFAKEKKMGCPRCYDEFSTTVSALLERLYEEPFHYGKCPKKFCSEEFLRQRVRRLDVKMQLALKGENYEMAAKLRDEITKWTPKIHKR